MPSQLEVHDVSVAYGDSTIVHDVTFVLETGAIAITGTGEELLADDRIKEAYLGAVN